LTADDIVDIVAMTIRRPLAAHAGQFSATPQIKITVTQSDWHKVGPVDGGLANRRSRNWRPKIHGKTKHS